MNKILMPARARYLRPSLNYCEFCAIPGNWYRVTWRDDIGLRCRDVVACSEEHAIEIVNANWERENE